MTLLGLAHYQVPKNPTLSEELHEFRKSINDIVIFSNDDAESRFRSIKEGKEGLVSEGLMRTTSINNFRYEAKTVTGIESHIDRLED
jgi:hypothetical protein